jgi:hypothetical protein
VGGYSGGLKSHIIFLSCPERNNSAALPALNRFKSFESCEDISQHDNERCGRKFFAEICRRDLEGIVGKRNLSVYKDDGLGWVKIKNRKYSQAEGRRVANKKALMLNRAPIVCNR